MLTKNASSTIVRTYHAFALSIQIIVHRQVAGPSRDDPNTIVHDLYEPCAPRAAGAMEMNWTQIDGEKLKEPLVSMVCVISLPHLPVNFHSNYLKSFWAKVFKELKKGIL